MDNRLWERFILKGEWHSKAATQLETRQIIVIIQGEVVQRDMLLQIDKASHPSQIGFPSEPPMFRREYNPYPFPNPIYQSTISKRLP